jgi:4-hydroxy-3-polyprenylbenzoate decarboxylase
VRVADAQSLRPWLAELADDGRLVEIAETLDPAAGLAARLVAHHREPVRVGHVHGSEFPLVANLLAGRALIAEALGVDEHGLGAHLQRALAGPLEPVVVADAPCQEVDEQEPDLTRLPIPRFFEHEGGPYITAGCIVTRDPETGERNWSIARVRPLGASRALVGIAPNHHLAIAARAARERGERLPIAVTIGNHPALMVAACLYLGRGEDELRIAGALLGEPVELVRCAAVALEVPAACEIVLEGFLDIGETVEEGPVSEFHGGYERYGRAATATFDRLTHRRDAIYQAVLPGFHPEHALIGGVAIAAGLERTLRRLAPSVHAVAVPESGAGRLAAVVALGRHEAGEARTVAVAALEAVNLVKLATVVDADVDPWDDASVAHAVATRVHFDRDLHVLPGMRADRAEPLERGGVIAKLAIDATRKAGDRDDWTAAEPPRPASG